MEMKGVTSMIFLTFTDTANNVWKKKKEDVVSTTVDCPKDWAM